MKQITFRSLIYALSNECRRVAVEYIDLAVREPNPYMRKDYLASATWDINRLCNFVESIECLDSATKSKIDKIRETHLKMVKTQRSP
jgi:hypothetical protein